MRLELPRYLRQLSLTGLERDLRLHELRLRLVVVGPCDCQRFLRPVPLVLVERLQRLPQLPRKLRVLAGALRLPLELREPRRDLFHQQPDALDVLVRRL